MPSKPLVRSLSVWIDDSRKKLTNILADFDFCDDGKMSSVYYLVPKDKLRIASGKKEKKADWEACLDAFRNTRQNSAAQYMANLLKAMGIVPNERGELHLNGVKCSAITLIRNLVNPNTKLVNESRAFLSALKKRADTPEAIKSLP